MAVSFAVSFLMLAGKVWTYVVTDSAAVFSDAAESVVHLLATAVVAWSLWYSIQPPDRGHPYGHGKAAYFATGFEGGLISIAALFIIYSSVLDLIAGPTLHSLGTGLWMLAVLCVINGSLGYYLIWTGRRHQSLVLVSNGKHVLTDMWTSLGVLVGVGLVWLTDLVWLDPAVAIAVALNIMWTAFGMVRQSVRGLMERAEPNDTQVIVAQLNQAQQEGVILSYHQLRHRRVDNQIWVDYHLLFPAEMTLIEAHDRSHVVEDAIAEAFEEDVFVTAHLEPEHHRDAHPEHHEEPLDPLRG